MILNAVIEIPAGSRLKIEKVGDHFRVDRVLAITYPEAYGYIEGTLSEDGDPLDVFIITRFDLGVVSGLRLDIEPIKVVTCVDNGDYDHKIIAKIAGTTLEPGHLLEASNFIFDFLKAYKKGFAPIEVLGKREANRMVKDAQKRLAKSLNE